MIFNLTLTSPPPSVNATTKIGNGKSGKSEKISSNEYKAWRSEQYWHLHKQFGFSEDCYWRADVLVPGHRSGADLDNLAKGIFDAMGEAKKTPDDRYLVDFRFRWYAGDVVKIKIKMERVEPWATIRRASKSLAKKLAKFG